jgi:hypothetical protein
MGDAEVMEEDLLIFNLALRKALVKHGVFPPLIKGSSC